MHGEKVLKDISSSMKISLLWRFGLYALGLRFPIFPSQLISAFHSDTLSISSTHKTVILLHTTSSLFCAEARNMIFWTVGLLEAIQSVFFFFFYSLCITQPGSTTNEILQKYCKNIGLSLQGHRLSSIDSPGNFRFRQIPGRLSL